MASAPVVEKTFSDRTLEFADKAKLNKETITWFLAGHVEDYSDVAMGAETATEAVTNYAKPFDQRWRNQSGYPGRYHTYQKVLGPMSRSIRERQGPQNGDICRHQRCHPFARRNNDQSKVDGTPQL